MPIHFTNDFTLEEMTHSQLASRMGIVNIPSAVQLLRLSELCKNLLQPIRDVVGPLMITSGYRSKYLNSLVGGSYNSAHIEGYAADILPLNIKVLNCKDLAKTILLHNFKFDQMILEFGTESKPDWLHISNDPRMRGQVLQILNDGKGYKEIKL